MDRRRTRPASAALGAFALALTAGGLALADRGAPPIRAMLWVARDADPARALGSAPTECLTIPADPPLARAVEVGRAAFRTPVVLGGQAARAGVSCETCHRSGRSNPDFQFPGVSGAPGTADVTSSLFSTHRGDSIVDPRPIPDLSGAKNVLKVSQVVADHRLETFIHGLITEEFDGPEPTPAILAGLAAYVRALDPAACPANRRQPFSVALLMDDTRRALVAARAEAAAGDGPSAVVMVAAARARLGLIDERFDTPALGPQRQALRAADRRLAQAQDSLRARRPDAERILADWLKRSRSLQAGLEERRSASLFDAHRLAWTFKHRLPG